MHMVRIRINKATMMRGIFIKIFLNLLPALLLFNYLKSTAIAASDEDLRTLGMFYEASDLVVSATRNPIPISQSAENITVITAAEIEMMGAHTLADVLSNIPGVNIDDRGSVGTYSSITMQGSSYSQVLVMLDGVRLNDYATSVPDIVALPVQNIERIEIVKGPASSSWGSALGGVVNIVTKDPNEDRKYGGLLSASIGEKLTRDAQGEASGNIDGLGYYLFAGHLASDGLSPHTGIESNNLFGKLRWDLPEGGNLLFTVNYNRDSRQDGQSDVDNLNADTKFHQFLATLSFNYPLSDHADLDLSFRTTSRLTDSIAHTLSTGDLSQDLKYHEYTYGGSAKFSWRGGINNLAAGVDFDHIESDTDPNSGFDFNHITLHSDKWGGFLNDTLLFKDLAISPGIRYDRMNPVGDFFSPSLGIAWNPTAKITLRSYVGYGYSLPIIQPGQPQEKVLTFQAGVETTQIPFVWFKTTFFRNQLSDVENFNTGLLENELKQGVEVEVKSLPIFYTSVSAGYTFIDITNRDTGEIIKNMPRNLVKLGLHYNDDRYSFRGALLGRYVDWNATPDANARYSAVIWDLNLAKKVFTVHDTAMELFFNAHNLFNGAQYPDGEFKNALRWVEGGIRFNF